MARNRKTGGRQKGTPNRVTGTLRDILLQIVQEQLQLFPEMMSSLKPKERLNVIIKLTPFVIPKVTTDLETKESKASSTNSYVQGILEKIDETQKLTSFVNIILSLSELKVKQFY